MLNTKKLAKVTSFALLALMLLIQPVAAQPAGNGDMLPPPGEAGAGKAVDIVEVMSQAEIQALFEEARQRMRSVDAVKTPPEDTESEPRAGEDEMESASEAARNDRQQPVNYVRSRGVGDKGFVPLRDVDLRLAYQNMTIEDIMKKVTEEINRQSGGWQVQWRLTEENRDLIEQRVNINAESTFDEFLSHLTAKINNLTGVRLFVKVFEVSRVIIIADTF